MWTCWAAIRLLGALILVGHVLYPQVDASVTASYGYWAHELYAGHLPWRGFNVEYPPGVLPFMALPGTGTVYELQFVALAIAADFTIAKLLWRSGPRGIGSWFWLVLPIVLGPVMWARLDIFVAAALIGFVVAVREARWRTAAVCLAGATLLKLWPIVVLIVVWRLIPPTSRRTVAAWTVGVVTTVTVPVIAYGGGHGLLWMLRYQGARGLEIESVWAWPVIVAHSLGAAIRPLPGHGGLEVPVSGTVSLAITLVLPLALAGVTAYVWHDRGRRLTVGRATLLTAAVVLICSKVLSPQYVIWACALTVIVIDESPTRDIRAHTRLVIATLLLAATTQAVYPFSFFALYFATPWGVLAASLHAVATLVWAGAVIQYTTTASGVDIPEPRSEHESRLAVELVTSARWNFFDV
jgi:glycosyl transferase family 87